MGSLILCNDICNCMALNCQILKTVFLLTLRHLRKSHFLQQLRCLWIKYYTSIGGISICVRLTGCLNILDWFLKPSGIDSVGKSFIGALIKYTIYNNLELFSFTIMREDQTISVRHIPKKIPLQTSSLIFLFQISVGQTQTQQPKTRRFQKFYFLPVDKN